jgi:hypothetical protein
VDRFDGGSMAIYVIIAFAFLLTCIAAIIIETI